ncbi:hypothetical protein [Kribbella sp. NPDC051770]|uniref:hypothetical protein n=1 Tax=Kribbella sp. NPDC051770 TaxID=3155413 RepID=UPI00341E16BA
MLIFCLLLVAAALVALAVWAKAKRDRLFAARTEQAVQAGWTPIPVDPALEVLANRLLAPGTNTRMVAGEYAGHYFRAFDHSHSASRTSTATKQHLVAVLLNVSLPPIAVTTDSAIGRTLGVPDQELESGHFNDAFVVEAPNQRYASAVVHPQLMEWMLQHPHLQWWIDGPYLVTWGMHWWTVDGVNATLDELTTVLRLIPPFVLTDYRLS